MQVIRVPLDIARGAYLGHLDHLGPRVQRGCLERSVQMDSLALLDQEGTLAPKDQRV